MIPAPGQRLNNLTLASQELSNDMSHDIFPNTDGHWATWCQFSVTLVRLDTQTPNQMQKAVNHLVLNMIILCQRTQNDISFAYLTRVLDMTPG